MVTTASQPKRARVWAALQELARDEIGPDATAVGWVVEQVANGAVMRQMSNRVIERTGEKHTLEWFRRIVHQLEGIKPRLVGARIHAERRAQVAAEEARTLALATTDVPALPMDSDEREYEVLGESLD